MAIKLLFDTSGGIEIPTMVLCRQNCKKINAIPHVYDVVFGDSFGNASEFSFKVYKSDCPVWEQIQNFRTIYIPEWNTYYRLKIDVNHSTSLIKTIVATHLAEAELSDKRNYSMEINTDTEMDTDYYKSSILYNQNNTEVSILHRIIKNAPLYNIVHVDESIAEIQRSFSFDDKSVYDCLVEVASEIGFHFECDIYIDKNTGEIKREISVYDLESVCNNCGNRGDFTVECSECGSTDIVQGYGEDTTIFISNENLADEIKITTDTDSVKNCFHLTSSDEDFDSAIKLCNPNGTSDIWYHSTEDQEDMSSELYEKLYTKSDTESEKGYYQIYDYYNEEKDYTSDILPNEYNELVQKYMGEPYEYEDIELTNTPLIGYQSVVNAYYNAEDMIAFLTSILMPSIGIAFDSSASDQEISLANYFTNNTIAIEADSIENVTETMVKSAVLSMAKVLIDSRYSVKISDYTYTNGDNSGMFKFYIENYSDETDSYTSESYINVLINTDYEQFLREKIQKVLEKGDDENYGIASLLSSNDLKDKLKLYGITPLENIRECVNGVLSVLVDQGVCTDPSKSDLKISLYDPYFEKLSWINDEIEIRTAEIQEIVEPIRTRTLKVINYVHEKLNLENFLGTTLWTELNLFKRDSSYSNSNFIYQDTNGKTIDRITEFYNLAVRDLVKSATMQHSLSASLKNIIALREFRPLLDHFAVGNWLRVELDGQIYKLRLLSYELDFNNHQNMTVEFSDVTKIGNDVTDLESVIKSAKTMGATYSYVEQQASDGSDAYKTTDDWVKKGLDTTLTKIINSADSQDIVFDETGLLFRKKEEYGDGYDPRQMKFINSTISITKNGWETISTAVGRFYYLDYNTGKIVEGYGVNCETLIGNIIIGNGLGIYTSNGKLSFDNNGFVVTNDMNTVAINPNSSSIFTILRGNEEVISFDNNGNANINGTITTGNITATGGKIGSLYLNENSLYYGTSSMSSTTSGIYLGADGFRQYSSADAYVNIQNGKITAYGANINGTITTDDITATGGKIGDIIINDGYLLSYQSGSNYAIQMGNGSIVLINTGKADTDFTKLSSNSLIFVATVDSIQLDTQISYSGIDMLYGGQIWFTAYHTSSGGVLDVSGNINLNGTTNILGTTNISSVLNVVCPGYTTSCLSVGTVDNNGVPILNSACTLERKRTSPSHVGITSTGGFCTLSESSSKRYKNTIQDLDLDFVKDLYTIPLHTFIYNDDYLNTFDERYHKTIPGFIAEELDEILPIAVDHNEDGSVEKWNDKVVIPCLLKLIQNNHKEIQELKEQIRQLLFV